MLSTLYPFGGLAITNLAQGQKARMARQPSQPETGWDSVRESWLIQASAGMTADAVAEAHFQRGNRLGTENLWIVDVNPREVGSGLFVADITAAGLLGAKGYKASYSAVPATTQGENVSVSGYGEGEYDGIWPRVTALEPEVTVSLSYLVVGERPSTAVTGTEQTPPAPWEPEVRPSSWVSLPNPTLHVPYGWVLMARNVEGLAGVGTYPAPWLVTDQYQYVFPLTP